MQIRSKSGILTASALRVSDKLIGGSSDHRFSLSRRSRSLPHCNRHFALVSHRPCRAKFVASKRCAVSALAFRLTFPQKKVASCNNPVRLEQKNLKVVHTVQVPSELAIQHPQVGNEKRYLVLPMTDRFSGESTEYFPLVPSIDCKACKFPGDKLIVELDERVCWFGPQS